MEWAVNFCWMFVRASLGQCECSCRTVESHLYLRSCLQTYKVLKVENSLNSRCQGTTQKLVLHAQQYCSFGNIVFLHATVLPSNTCYFNFLILQIVSIFYLSSILFMVTIGHIWYFWDGLLLCQCANQTHIDSFNLSTVTWIIFIL